MDKIILIALFISSCISIPDKIEDNTLYRRDMVVEINGKVFQGTATPPKSDIYAIHVYTKGELDLFTLETCHREDVTEKAWNIIKRKGLFRRKIEIKNELEFTFTPTEIEKTDCPILLGGFEQKKGRHSWAFVDPQEDREPLTATSSCNGTIQQNPTVTACQTKAGLIQSIQFDMEVVGSCEDGCNLPKSTGKKFEWATGKGRCACMFVVKGSDRYHRLTTIGYDRVLLREE